MKMWCKWLKWFELNCSHQASICTVHSVTAIFSCSLSDAQTLMPKTIYNSIDGDHLTFRPITVCMTCYALSGTNCASVAWPTDNDVYANPPDLSLHLTPPLTSSFYSQVSTQDMWFKNQYLNCYTVNLNWIWWVYSQGQRLSLSDNKQRKLNTIEMNLFNKHVYSVKAAVRSLQMWVVSNSFPASSTRSFILTGGAPPLLTTHCDTTLRYLAPKLTVSVTVGDPSPSSSKQTDLGPGLYR